MLVVPPGELARSDAPLALVYQCVTGGDPVLISVISSLAVTNGALIQIIMCSRVCYGLSRQGWLPEVLGRIHTVTRTPLIATALISAAILIMALWLPIETLAKATSFLILVVFALINLALWRIKQREPRPVGVFLVSSWVPIAGFAASTLFVLYQFVTELR
ncbi:MAG: amino acid permease [Gammaproteobacteria bacterium]